MNTERTFILYLRPARCKAREAATVEALCLLHDLKPTALPGGPLSEQGSIVWVAVPDGATRQAVERFPLLGYTQAVDLVEQPLIHGEDKPRMVRWRGQSWHLVRMYEEDAAMLREQAPDRRTFYLETGDGVIRPIKGYRGDGQTLSRRGLPVYDARFLVNLVFIPTKGTLLDPFAGIGGIVIEAIHSGWNVLSVDIDPALRHGLARLGGSHHVADVRDLPVASASVDAIATEPPYDRQADDILAPAFREMHRVLREGGRLALLCADWQAEGARQASRELGLIPYLDSPINRKGIGVVALAWQKAAL